MPATGPVNDIDQFDRIADGPISGVVHRHWRDEIASPVSFMQSIEAAPGNILRKGGGQGITARREFPFGPLFVKIYSAGNLHRRLRDLLGEGRAMREWRANCAAQALGINTATVVAALTRRQGWAATHLFLTAPAPGGDAVHLLRNLHAGGEERGEILRLLGRYVASLHARGFWHAHLHCKHIFLNPARDLTLIDLERSAIIIPLPEAKRLRNLRQMRKSLSSIVEPAEVMHFDEGYNSR